MPTTKEFESGAMQGVTPGPGNPEQMLDYLVTLLLYSQNNFRQARTI